MPKPNFKSFDILAYTGGKLHVDGFDKPVVVDLNGLQASGEIPIAIKHDTSEASLIGQTDPDGIDNDGKQLRLRGPVTADPETSPKVKRVFAMAAKGHKWQSSIGARIEESREVAAGESVEVNGQTLEGPFLLATRSVLRENSVLGMGADKSTSVSFAACAVLNLKAEAAEGDNENDDEVEAEFDEDAFNSWVTDVLEMDPSTLNDATRQALMQQYAESLEEPIEAEDGDDEPPADGDKPPEEKGKKVMAKGKTNLNAQARIAEGRKLEANEARRVHKIKTICAKDTLLMAKAIDGGWSVIKAENEFLKRQRPQAPAGHVRTETPETQLQALQGAMMLRAGCSLDHTAYSGHYGFSLNLPSWVRAGLNTDQRQRAMEAAHRYRDMSMVDLCRISAALDGNNSPELDGSNQGFIRAAVSGGSLQNIFNTNINARFIEKLIEAGDTTAGWTQDSEANNFQTMDRGRLVKGSRLTKHERGGKADHVTRSDQKESYKIARYSEMFTVDEMDMIDDNFGALNDISDEMSLACSRLRPDLCYSILFANANLQATGQALFSATQPGSQANLVGSGGALNSANLQAAMAAMFNFLENAVGLNIYPTHILVPMVLAGTAYNLLQGQNIAMAGTSGSVIEKGDVNPLQALQTKWGRVEVVSDQRLTNGVVDPNTGTVYSGSTTTWRLASSKTKTIEVSTLRGSGKAPQIRPFKLDKGEWGIGWDCKMDIGAKALEWRGLYESRV